MKIISVASDGFHEPGQLCKLGETVRFINHDEVDHELTGPFDSFTLKPGEQKDIVLVKAGTSAFKSNKLSRMGQLNVQV